MSTVCPGQFLIIYQQFAQALSVQSSSIVISSVLAPRFNDDWLIENDEDDDAEGPPFLFMFSMYTCVSKSSTRSLILTVALQPAIGHSVRPSLLFFTKNSKFWRSYTCPHSLLFMGFFIVVLEMGHSVMMVCWFSSTISSSLSQGRGLFGLCTFCCSTVTVKNVTRLSDGK